ncbi:MAG: TRAP transporter small permease subunit [Proteobacteria bacterium]|nr:TRAP transporter small permease subunit [Pseudomonadota bacterium]
MKVLKQISHLIDELNEKVGIFVSWITGVLVLIIVFDVIMRYAFNETFVFVQELEWHVFSFIFLIGAGYTLKHDQHVRVDVFYQAMNQRKKAIVNISGTLLLLIPGCLIVLKSTIPWTVTAFEIMETSPDPGGIPMRFILKSFVPIGFFLVFLQGISMLITSMSQLIETKANQPKF